MFYFYKNSSDFKEAKKDAEGKEDTNEKTNKEG